MTPYLRREVAMLFCFLLGSAFFGWWWVSRQETPPERSGTPLRSQGVVPMETATFAAGCFWGIEAAFRRIPGVVDTAVGYSGGHVESPTYRQVCTGTTGHAEAVEVRFDPTLVPYDRLLDVFWSIHDPTTPDRQGPDIGPQYRSVVFYHDDDQRNEAEASKRRLEASERFGRPVVTEIVPAATFHRAEEYHQRYLEKRGQTSCRTSPP